MMFNNWQTVSSSTTVPTTPITAAGMALVHIDIQGMDVNLDSN